MEKYNSELSDLIPGVETVVDFSIVFTYGNQIVNYVVSSGMANDVATIGRIRTTKVLLMEAENKVQQGNREIEKLICKYEKELHEAKNELELFLIS